MIQLSTQYSNRSLPLVGRVRVGVAQSIDILKNSFVISAVGTTPTPALPTRGRGKTIIDFCRSPT